MELMTASREWAKRPDDERFLSLDAMADHFEAVQRRSLEAVRPTKTIELVPQGLDEIVIEAADYQSTATNFAFGQLCTLSRAPADYVRQLPAPLAADNINYGLQFRRRQDEVGLLLDRANPTLRAATGPNYGRVWNADVVNALRDKFGDGVSGKFRVPGEFGKAVTVDKGNTTLYASDRDMFVFLADEENRIEVPNRRGGKSGSMARGFFAWNSEVGDKSLGLGTFLFDYVCMNRIVWGAEQYAEVRINHTSGAPDRFLNEVKPVLLSFANSTGETISEAIEAAQKQKLGDDLNAFFAKRNFSKKMVERFKAVHENEEGRPIETVWDASTAVTAYARGLTHQNERVALERVGGEMLKIAA